MVPPRVSLVLVLASLSMAASHATLQQPAFNHTEAADRVADTLRSASGGDFTVGRGSYMFFFLSDCAKYNLPSCFALNPDSPYGLTLLPPAPGEKPYRGCITKTGVCGSGCNPDNDPGLVTRICKDNMPMQWRLQPNEAVVLIGISPASAEYWSLTSYVMSQWYADSPRTQPADVSFIQGMAVKCPEGPARCQKFASLGTPFNYITLRESSASANASGFSEPFALVLTAQPETYHAVKEAVRAQTGLPTALLPYPANGVVNMGTDTDERDVFTMLMRVAYPQDPATMRQYYDSTPISVLRVTPPTSSCASFSSGGGGSGEQTCSLYGLDDMVYPDRATGVAERAGPSITHDELVAYVNELRERISITHGGSATAGYFSRFMKPFFVTGLNCIQQGTRCNGDCPDTLYPISSNIYNAVGCERLRVLPIGIGLCLLTPLLAFLCFLAPSCRRCRAPGQAGRRCCLCRGEKCSAGETTALIPPADDARRDGVDGAGVPSTNDGRRAGGTSSEGGTPTPGAAPWCWPRCCCCRCCGCCARLPDRPGVWWGLAVAVTLLVAALTATAVLEVYGRFCFWGQAATMDNGPSDIFVVYGVNHAATHHATYASITLYDYATLSGITSRSSENGYDGSAAVYLGSSHPAVPYLFAYRFTRNCETADLVDNYGEPAFCFSVPSSGNLSLPLSANAFWIERMYINPTTHTGPAANETILANLLHFT